MSKKTRHLQKVVENIIEECENPTAGQDQKPTKSLGALRKAKKTKPRSPDVTGKLSLQRHTLAAIIKEIAKTGGEEVICSIAGWRNQDKHGEYLTVEISPRFVPNEQ